MAKYEHELAALDDTGLDDVTTDAALAYLLGHVQGHARAAHDAARATTDTAISDADWWAVNQPVLADALNPACDPRAVRVQALPRVRPRARRGARTTHGASASSGPSTASPPSSTRDRGASGNWLPHRRSPSSARSPARPGRGSSANRPTVEP